MPQLPEEVSRQGVTVKKKSSAILQVLAIYSPDSRYDTLFLSNYATINMLDNIKRVPGVGDAYLFGALDYSMRVWLNTDRLTALGLTPTDVAKALQGQNVQAAVGRIGAQPIGDAQFQLNIQTKGRLTEPEEFENVVVRANPDGSYVRVRDVGRVELAARTSNSFGRFNGGPGALIAIFQAPGANALATAEGVQAVMQRLQAAVPGGRRLQDHLRFDRLRAAEHRRGDPHPDRGVHPGGDRRLPVPGQSPRHADPADRRAGVADRHLRRHAGARLLA